MSKKPNLLIVLCDQLRRSALSVYGDPNLQTPNLDRLAREGVRFANACSTYPICVPFRYTLMTGEYAHARMIPGIGWRMSPNERTLADEFNEAGYQTLYVGKWHLYGGQIGMPGYSARHEGVKPVPPLYQGRWQHWRGFELRNSHFDTYYFIDDDPNPHPIDAYQTDGLFDLAMDFIRNERDRGKPFCCVLSVEPPHPPMEAPPDLEAKWLATELQLPPNFMVQWENRFADAMGSRQDPEERREDTIRHLQLYYAMVENLDQNIGRLRHFLGMQKLEDDTIVIFLSDHGEFAGSHALRHKQYPFEESVGIPLIVSGPGIPLNRVIEDPVATEDLFPTLLGLAGLKPRASLPGVDASALIRGKQPRLHRPGVMLQFVWETRPSQPFHRCVWRAFRSARYKYAVAGDLFGCEPWQFFDLQEDPYELNNLIDSEEHEPLIAQHHRWLYARMSETGDDMALAPAYDCHGLNVEWPG